VGTFVNLPADSAGSGEGFVTYTIGSSARNQTGAVLNAQATVIFSTQPPADQIQPSFGW
jgi:hypothetical protein